VSGDWKLKKRGESRGKKAEHRAEARGTLKRIVERKARTGVTTGTGGNIFTYHSKAW
jgi:hypothetical protein